MQSVPRLLVASPHANAEYRNQENTKLNQCLTAWGVPVTNLTGGPDTAPTCNSALVCSLLPFPQTFANAFAIKTISACKLSSKQTNGERGHLMPTDPLLQLIVGNIADAQEIGLIDKTNASVHHYLAKVRGEWADASKTPLEKYDHHMLSAFTALDAAYRPRQVFTGKKITIVRVCPLWRLVQWLPKIVLPPEDKKFEFINALQNRPFSMSDAKRISDGCMEISRDFGSDHGKLAYATDITFDRLFWIGRINHKGPSNSAQVWRDRLGLIHLKPDSTGVNGDMLVRAQFQVVLSKTKLIQGAWQKQMALEPKGLWLIRPTVVHRGNQRWMQSYASDRGGLVIRKHGRTRDLSSATFQHAEPELLLVAGNNAKVRFKSVELLDGLPIEDGARNNSDHHFVSMMNSERGWS